MPRLITSIVVLLSSLAAIAAPAPKDKFHLYLLVGQSNMAGRGKVEEQDRTPHPRIFMLDAKDEWVPAREPLHFDKPGVAGVGPGFAFAKAMAEANPEVTIGLIPSAVGGTALAAWQPGATDAATKTTPYDTAIRRTKIAMKDGTLKGLIWHQGEGDTGETNAPTYGARLETTMARFRDDLGVDDLPVVVGQLAPFKADNNPGAQTVNRELAFFPRRLALSATVPATGLDHRGDNLHFNAPSAREFGRRCAAEMLRLQALPKPAIIPLWPNGLPDGAKALAQPEVKRNARVTKVSNPTLSIYLPSKEKATGLGILICPGGGYGALAIEKEGDCVARWLNELGHAAFVLKYRLKDYPQPAALNDAIQALRLLRKNPADYRLDPKRLGIMGFSAGGHLAAQTSNTAPADVRPAFSILIYSVVPQPGDKWVKEMYTAVTLTDQTPPAFLVHARNDGIPAQLSIDYAEALKKRNIPVELLLFDTGGHGFGMGVDGGDVAAWPEKCAAWLKTR